MCYSHLILFEELNSKRILNRIHGANDTVDHSVIKDADRVYRYGVSLVRSYTPWNTANLPNPEEYDAADIYIEKANGAFVLAMVFILCHEYAHIDLKHLDEFIATADKQLTESDADEQAVRTMLKGATNPSKKLNYGVGMLLGLCSLLTLQRELETESHPHLAGRIERVLRAQELDDTSPLWGIATMSFKLWDNLYNQSRPCIRWPSSAKTFKDLFYHVLWQLK
jgi:hypothetical protein